MSSQSPHHRVSTHQQHYHNNSPTTTLSEDDSNSEPNDLRTNPEKIRHHSAATFPGYPFFGTGQHNSGSMPSQHSQHSSGQQYVATNECRLIEYRGARIAAFLSANRSQCSEYLLCLPQAFELFLKHLVGGLHTVYTKLKRLDIVPIVCNVEQVRILRGLGAIQPGVNRCKLLSTQDFDVLYKDCTTASLYIN
ncbi:unnamed protein product [Oppiella nova]|uniref:SKI/SNO/DAC domain-containing protein n=1 Tax=Oppiella nova TaxID=334625 RepID=A0A7R9Q954_9ACAR|nr:unnamed protein product [Oppiella nova]CAG2159020.1 unnamed protein product [Oppiella nova]